MHRVGPPMLPQDRERQRRRRSPVVSEGGQIVAAEPTWVMDT